MIFTYDFHIFSDSGGLPELMKGEMCVCVFACVPSILGGLVCYRITLLGAVCGQHNELSFPWLTKPANTTEASA